MALTIKIKTMEIKREGRLSNGNKLEFPESSLQESNLC